MQILLDTHILIWFLSNDPQLTEKQLGLIMDGRNKIYVSIASLWEIAIKQGIANLPSFVAEPETIVEQLEYNRIELLAIAPTQLSLLKGLPQLPNHKDPFDRLLIATTLAKNLSMMTVDEKVKIYALHTQLNLI